MTDAEPGSTDGGGSEGGADADAAAPLGLGRPVAVVRRAWRDFLSVYYATTPAWRWLKSGALVFFGLFCWTAAGVLHSYRPAWDPLTYVMAYGFLLVVWGPLTHFLIVPLSVRLRRSDDGRIRALAKRASKLNLGVFIALVLVLGTVTPGVMLLDFDAALDGDSGGSVDPDLSCVRDEATVRCKLSALSNPDAVDRVVVTTGGSPLTAADGPPFAVEFRVADLETVAGQRQFVVELRDGDGATLRRYVRSLDSVPRASGGASTPTPASGG